jgi:hypothetical protein
VRKGGGAWHIIEATHKTATVYPPLCFQKILKTKEETSYFICLVRAHAWWLGMTGFPVSGRRTCWVDR